MLPTSVRLDARDHDALVSEATQRVRAECPELAQNGGQDPAGTLIELFAWMTGLAIDRLGRVPDKLHVALLDILGLRLDGPAAARAGLRLRLSAPATEPLEVRAGSEAGTLRTATLPSVVFAVLEDFTIMPVRPAAYVVQRGGSYKAIGVADGVADPVGKDQLPFDSPPKPGDALLLGFEDSIAQLLLRVSLEASPARGAGVRPDDPPLRWECSQGDSDWAEAEVLQDLTGGFNYGSGSIDLQCPLRSGIEPIAGRRLHWLRCRIAETTRISREPAIYTQPPEIYRITAAGVGATVIAENSVLEVEEQLGVSDGSAGQTFATRFRPLLALSPGETLEVENEHGDWEPWDECDSFAGSRASDRHFMVDHVSGQIQLGPSLRHGAGGTSQHGAVPPKGAALRISRYRHGGGQHGNVEAGRINTLRNAIPGVASVTNPVAARGGVDSQSIESLRARSAMEIRTRYRAVTTEDFEFLATEATPKIARAHRVLDDEPGIRLQILPRIDPSDRYLTFDELRPDETLLDEVGRYLDRRKLVGTPVRLLPMRFRGASVVVNLQVAPRADVGRIEREVLRALYVYLNPLTGGSAGGQSEGWPPGRSLNQGELYVIVHAFEGIEHIRLLRLYEFDLETGEQAQKPAGRQITLGPDEVIASGRHIVKATRREE